LQVITHIALTRNAANTNKPRDAFRDINLRKIPWPWNQD